jgi:subtilisin family serine protease
VTTHSRPTGRGVRIAIIDSGVHAEHPHVNGVSGGVAIDADGRLHDDFVDRLGHGTAVTAAIRDLAPAADLFAVKIFDRRLSTRVGSLVAALEWAARNGMHLANLSLGTPRREPGSAPANARVGGEAGEDQEAVLRAAVDFATTAGTLVVAARDDEGVLYLPGSLAGVLPVQVDWTCARQDYRIVTVDGVPVLRTSGLPRQIPGVPPYRNLHGVSFAVANATGLVACALEGAVNRSAAGVLRLLEGLLSGER